MIDLGEVSHYLGIAIDINPYEAEITFKQTVYPKKIFQRFDIQNSCSNSISIQPRVRNFLFLSEEHADKETIVWHQSVKVSLI